MNIPLSPMTNPAPAQENVGLVAPKPISADVLAKMAAADQLLSGFNKGRARPLVGHVKDVWGNVGDIEFLPTGLLPIDSILGGGFARGRLYELYGPEGSGKTSLCFKTIAASQRIGWLAGMIDAEQAFDGLRAATMSVDLDQLYLTQPDYGEQAIDIAIAMCKSKAFAAIVIDSVAALVPKSEYEGGMEDGQQMAHVAAMMSKAMRMLKGAAREGNTAVILINQLREKPGVTFGNPEYTPGGRAIKFFADVRVEIRRKGGHIKVGENIIGQDVQVKAVKNKLAPPMVPAMAKLYYDSRGFDELASVIETALIQGVLQRSGAWVNVPLDTEDFVEMAGHNIGQGFDNARAFIDQPENAAFKDKLIKVCTGNMLESRKKVIEHLTQSVRMGQIAPDFEHEQQPTKKKRAPKKDEQ